MTLLHMVPTCLLLELPICTTNNVVPFRDKLATNEAFTCFVLLCTSNFRPPRMDPTVSLPNLASNDNHIGHVDWTAATCTWHISTHFWCCENAIPWRNLASNETDAEHIELTEYGYEDIESCIRKQTLISNLLWQPTVQRLKSDNVKVNCLHHFWKE